MTDLWSFVLQEFGFMGIKELAAQVAAAHPDIAANQINAVLRTALKAIRDELSSTTEKSVKMAPLGNFTVVDKPAEADGEGDGDSKRKVHLRLAKERTAEEKAANVADNPERAAKRATREASKAERQATRKAGKAEKPGKAT
jgi:nucleoid DNA-binding protein